MSQIILRFGVGGHIVKKGDGRCNRINYALNENGGAYIPVSSKMYGRNCSTSATDYQVKNLGGLYIPSLYNGFRVLLYPEQNPVGNEYVLMDTGIYNEKLWRAYHAGDFGWKAVAIQNIEEYLPPDYDCDQLNVDGKLPIGGQNCSEIIESYRPPNVGADVPFEFIIGGIVGVGTIIYAVK